MRALSRFSESGSSLATVLFRSVSESLGRPRTAAGACRVPGCLSGHGMRRGDGQALLLCVLDALITREEVVVEAEDGREVSGYDLLTKLHSVITGQ